MQKFRDLPLLGILRGVQERDITPLLETAIDAGLGAIEITMNTANACELIEQMRDTAKEHLLVGAGTVLNRQDYENARAAGAQFIVTPVLIDTVAQLCREHSVPHFPGALTPTEVFKAWDAGAEMVKLFPASNFGPAYIKELRGPFKQIQLLACGGVSASNIADYLDCGANGAAFGGSIFRQEWLERGEFDKIGAAIQALKQAFLEADRSIS